MGSKRIKAIACAGRAPISLANKDAFQERAKRQIDLLDESILKVGFEAFGTNMVSDMVNARGGYPTRNWQEGVFEDIDEVGEIGPAGGIHIPKLVELYKQGRLPFDRLIGFYPFDEINKAVEDMVKRRVLKPVLRME